MQSTRKAMNHNSVSFAKSGIRIGGFLLLAFGLIVPAAVALILAELLGIAEELV